MSTELRNTIEEIIKERKYAFNTQIIFDELIKRNIKTTKNSITKIIKELNYTFNKHSKIWELKKIDKPLMGKVFIPEIHFAILNKKSRQVLYKDHYILGVIFSKDRASELANTAQEKFNLKVKEIMESNKELEVLADIKIIETIGNMAGEDLIFQIDYKQEN